MKGKRGRETEREGEREKREREGRDVYYRQDIHVCPIDIIYSYNFKTIIY